MNINGGVRVIGVTSHAYDWTDCREKGGVDTRVDYYLDWIDDEMRTRCESDERVWCDEEGIIPPDDLGGGSTNTDNGQGNPSSEEQDDEGYPPCTFGYDLDCEDEESGSCSTNPRPGSWSWIVAILALIGLRSRFDLMT